MSQYKRRKRGKINKKDLLNKKMTVRVTSEDKLVLKQIRKDLDKPTSYAEIVRTALYGYYSEYFDKR